MSSRRQGIFWILTIPYDSWVKPSELPDSLAWITGQPELGRGGYRHWQLCVAFRKKTSLAGVKTKFGSKCHAELSRSEAAAEYCSKLDTRDGEHFELGAKPFRRNSSTDWEEVWTAAKSGNMDAIPAHARVVCYRSLRSIGGDYDKPKAMVRTCRVFWGATGTGKSRRAWDEAGLGAYCKDPRTKFWCGYAGEGNVVIDEFRGGIDISHMLRWLDRYPVRVEVKGGSRPLAAETFWITSNISPDEWYPDVDPETNAALRRRLTVTHFN